jgi:hypothetical protein
MKKKYAIIIALLLFSTQGTAHHSSAACIHQQSNLRMNYSAQPYQQPPCPSGFCTHRPRKACRCSSKKAGWETGITKAQFAALVSLASIIALAIVLMNAPPSSQSSLNLIPPP